MLWSAWCVRVRVKFTKCNFFSVCNGPAVPPAIYSEPRFHESFVVNSQQVILETSVGKNSRFTTLNRWTRNVVSSEDWNICTRKHICWFNGLDWSLLVKHLELKIHTTLGYIVSLILLNLGYVKQYKQELCLSSTYLLFRFITSRHLCQIKQAPLHARFSRVRFVQINFNLHT